MKVLGLKLTHINHNFIGFQKGLPMQFMDTTSSEADYTQKEKPDWTPALKQKPMKERGTINFQFTKLMSLGDQQEDSKLKILLQRWDLADLYLLDRNLFIPPPQKI